MAETPKEEGGLARVRRALFAAFRKALDLADATERLEAAYTDWKQPEPEDPEATSPFYAPTSDLEGRELDPDWFDEAPSSKRRVRREAVAAALALRAAVDEAIRDVAGASRYMDSAAESVDRRWTARTIGLLRKLRGAIVRGHGLDARPSALPMIRAGVPEALRKHAEAVRERMEEVKTAIMAGVESAGVAVNGTASAIAPVVADGAASAEAANGAVTPARASDAEPAGPAKNAEPPDGAFLSEADLARIAGVNPNTLRTALRKWRPHHHNNDWHSTPNPRPRDPRYMYRWGAVKGLIDELPKTGKPPAER